jgi:hypothetical protein
MEVEFYLEALQEALAKYGKPEILTPLRAVSLPVPHSLLCCRRTGLRSAWMAEVPGVTTSLSNVFGAR